MLKTAKPWSALMVPLGLLMVSKQVPGQRLLPLGPSTPCPGPTPLSGSWLCRWVRDNVAEE